MIKTALGILTLLIFPFLAYNGYKHIQPTFSLDHSQSFTNQAPKSKHSWVGASTIDITPPPGRSASGYATGAKKNKGFRTRLKARSFYIEPQEGPAVLLIQLDLLSGSNLLHRDLGARLAKISKLSPGAIMLAGTHTHGGPGNYFGSNFYNDWASLESGLYQPYYEFLLDQLEAVSIDAIKNKRQGTATMMQTQVNDLSRNRSLGAFLANGSKKEFNLENSINPNLTVLRLDGMHRGQLKPFAIFSSFSIHGTAIGAKDLYNADLFHYPSSVVKDYIRKSYKLPWEVTIGVTNGSHGDNSPNWRKQGFQEAKRLGSKLGEAIIHAFKQVKVRNKETQTAVATEEIDLLARALSGQSPLCPPKVGMSLLGGAEDYRTPILSDLPGFAEGWPQESSHCQGAKRIFGSFLQNSVIKEIDFPRFATIQAIRINDLTLISMPFEVTKTMGLKLMKAIASPKESSALISCANGYMGYLTTESEYSQQHYEGGHTLYGPKSGEFFLKEVASLKKKLKIGKIHSRWQEWKHDLRIVEGEAIAKERPRFDISPQVVNMNRSEGAPYIYMTWVHETPLKMAFHQPLIAVQSKAKSKKWTTWLTDESSQIEVRLLQDSGNRAFYEARLHPPFNSPSPEIRFLVRGAKGTRPEYSKSVTIR
mgnify:CR=1 FL=1